MGLITRTSETETGWRRRPSARLGLGRLYSAGCTLAGAPTWPLWPGRVCYVQNGCAMSRGETLKSCRPVSLAGYQLPAAGPMPVNGLDKPN